MKKILLIILVFVGLAVNAQQVVEYRYSLFDDYLLNPAYVGNKDYYSLAVGVDQRFAGINVSPKTGFVSINSRLGRGYVFNKDGKINKFLESLGNASAGLQFTHFNFGPQREYNLGVTYGHHLQLGVNPYTKEIKRLTLGLTPRLYYVGYNEAALTRLSQDADPLLTTYNHLYKALFRADVSALYYTNKIELGLNIKNLVSPGDGFEFNKSAAQVVDSLDNYVPGYEAMYKPKIMFNVRPYIWSGRKTFVFDPSALIIYSLGENEFEYIIDLRFDWVAKEKKLTSIKYENVINAAAGLNINHMRNYKQLTVLQPYVSVDFKNYMVMFSYSFTQSEIQNAFWGGYQVMFKAKLGNERFTRKLRGKTTFQK